MVTQLPVPIAFSLSEGWHPVAPDEIGAPAAAFVALHPSSAGNGFTANITVGGQEHPPEVTLEQLADESAQRLSDPRRPCLRGRADVGTPQAPGLTQTLDIVTEGTPPLHLVQSQVYLSMHDVDSPRHVVVELMLTCTPEQLDTVLGDYQKFVASVHPATTAETPDQPEEDG